MEKGDVQGWSVLLAIGMRENNSNINKIYPPIKNISLIDNPCGRTFASTKPN